MSNSSSKQQEQKKKPLGRPRKYHTSEELKQANREKMAKYRKKHPERKEVEKEYIREWQRKRYWENKKLREMYLHTIATTPKTSTESNSSSDSS